MTSAKSSWGTLLQKGDGAGTESFTTIAEVRDITGPELSLKTADVTSHSSPEGWDETIGTILSGGEVKFDVNYIPANGTHNASTGLIADMTSRTLRNFKVVFPVAGSPTWVISALVTNVGPSAPVDGALTASVTLKISGKPTLV